MTGQSRDEADSGLTYVQVNRVVHWCSVQGSCQKKEGHRLSMLGVAQGLASELLIPDVRE